MNETMEIRWHGRGGQGTVTAAKMFAGACLSSGRYVQAFPEYGPERAGAPLQAYNRISAKELRKHCPVARPDIVVVIDVTLLDGIDVSAGTGGHAVFLVNAGKDKQGIKNKIGLAPGQRIYGLNGNQIAMDAFGRALPNAPVVAALARISGLAGLDVVVKDVEKSFGNKFSQKIVSGNCEAAKMGWQEVVEW